MQTRLSASSISFSLLALLLIFSFFINLSHVPLYIWDEARRANDALHMHLHGKWIIDYYDDNLQTRGTKSPFLLWLMVFCIRLFGINEWAIRFPSAVASFLIGTSLWLFCKHYYRNHWIGFLAGAVFASTYAWVFNHAGRSGDYDALLTLFSVLYCLCFYLYCFQNKNKWLHRFYIFLTLAVLIKGVSGTFFLPGLFVFTVVERKAIYLLKNKWFYIRALFFIGTIGSYYLLREIHAPGFLQAVYNNELGGRYFKELEQNHQPFLWYFQNAKNWRYSYWCYFAFAAFIIGFLNRSAIIRNSTLFNFCLVSTYGLIISFSKTKLYWYDLPVYPFLSIQIALLLYIVWYYFKAVPLLQEILKVVFIISCWYNCFLHWK